MAEMRMPLRLGTLFYFYPAHSSTHVSYIIEPVIVASCLGYKQWDG